MKLNRNYLLIAISSFAMLIVLIIQVNWIIKTAKIKEELFNEKANMVLARTADALSADKETCKNMGNCIGENEINKVDSLIQHYMKFYNFHMNYSFEVIQPIPFRINNNSLFNGNVYNKRIDEVVSKNGLVLKLIFPEKKQFIIEELSLSFITSVFLILVVLLMFWQTMLSLVKNKKILEHTTNFINTMTHEFKTPITNIALAGKMISKESTILNADKIKQYSSIILNENDKLKLQVEQILSMAAFERDEMLIQKTELNLHALLNDVLKCMHMQIENKQGELTLQLEAEHFIILGDKTHLTNAFCNLLDNALKYSKEKPEIRIQTKNTGTHIIITVSDNGIGIDKAYQKKVFDNFFRVPTGDLHEVKGFGIGLAYTKKVIDIHQGTIALESEIGKGTTYTIELKNV